jgi:hypothetical protein
LLISFLSIQIIFSKQVGDALLKNCTNHLLKIYFIEVKHILFNYELQFIVWKKKPILHRKHQKLRKKGEITHTKANNFASTY